MPRTWKSSRRPWTYGYASAAVPALLLLVLVPMSGAGSVDTPHVFVPGTTAVAGEVNANFAAHEAAIDDNAQRVQTLEADVDALYAEVEFLVGTSVGATPTALTLDGAAPGIDNVVFLPGDATWHLEMDVVGRRTDGGGAAGAAFRAVTFVETVGGSPTFIAAPQDLVAVADDAGWSATIQVNLDGAYVEVTGAAGQTVNWVARVRIMGVGD